MTAVETTMADRFKAAFRSHPAGVALITANGPHGPVGLTASSVASVAVDPTTLVFSVTRSSGSAGDILAADRLVVHLLRAENVEVARAFARSGEPRFTAEQEWTSLPTGEPLLASAPVAMLARPIHQVAVGSSTLVVAEVLDVIEGEPGTPLVYHDRLFHSLGGETVL